LVELELTETSMMLDPELAARMLGEIRRHGIKITVDDFGAGYSSLSYLRKLPIDKVKIDKSFIDEITQGRAPAALVGAMVNVAHSLDMTVVAEGVETPEQLKVIAGLNCDAWQGHLSTQALPADEFDAILKENKKYYSSCR
jgi:EAL domain-containing protein (putative c-di-GMP-specific phosphodiesterase class I)